MFDTHDQDWTFDPDKKWTISPVLSPNPDSTTDGSFVLTQGVIYKIEHIGTFQFQVQSNNFDPEEHEFIEFSRHGDENGKWAKIGIGTIVEVMGSFYLMNRTESANISIVPISA